MLMYVFFSKLTLQYSGSVAVLALYNNKWLLYYSLGILSLKILPSLPSIKYLINNLYEEKSFDILKRIFFCGGDVFETESYHVFQTDLKLTACYIPNLYSFMEN